MFHSFMCKCGLYPNCPSPSLSSLGSSFGNVANFQLLSLNQFLVMDTTSAIDYMKDVEVEDGVVDSLPARVLAPHMLHRPLHLAKTNIAQIMSRYLAIVG